MTALDSDKICSLIVWENGTAIDYPQEDIDRHGLTMTYEVICDNYDDCTEVDLFDADNDCIGSTTVGEIREFVYGGAE